MASRTRWASSFDAGRFSGGTLGSGSYSEGDLSSERSVHYLSFAVVSEFVELKDYLRDQRIEIECTPIRNPFNFKALPRVQCYLGSMGGDLVPTELTLDTVRVFWAVRMAFDDAMGPLAFGEPSFDSLIRLIRKALLSNHQLTFLVNGRACGIARLSRQDGEINYLLDIDEASGRRALTAELPWLYEVKTDTNTGGLAQLA